MDGHEIVFNQTIENIAAKLIFKVSDRKEQDDSVIYSEDTLRGLYQVCENRTSTESKVDIELLFNAIFANKNRIKQLFQ
jgi:ABC-2 type transport system ATP-binding protein